jgi:hypothetical protein
MGDPLKRAVLPSIFQGENGQDRGFSDEMAAADSGMRGGRGG